MNQEKKSMDCSIACAVMVLQHLGIEKNIESIKKEIRVGEEGTYSPQLGIYFLDNGFDVEIITFSPFLFTQYHKKLNQKETLEHFKVCFEKTKDGEEKRSLGYFIDFLKKGGVVKIKIPSIKDTENFIKSEIPVIVGLTSVCLSDREKPFFNFHDVLLTGFCENYFFVNNPSNTKKEQYLKEDFMYAVHASAYRCSDNGSFLVVKKPLPIK